MPTTLPDRPLSPNLPNRRAGLAAALVSYLFWGFMALYWNLLARADSWEVIAHRVVWTFVFVLALLLVRGRRREILRTVETLKRDLKRAGILLAAAVFASLNWWINVIGVVTEQVVQLGFCQYLAPILTLLLGIFWFEEPFGKEELLPLLFIWSGILLFSAAEVRELRAAKKA